MNTIKLSIHDDIFRNYPETRIGYIVVKNLNNINDSKVLQSLDFLPIQGINRYGLTLQNIADFSTISKWRDVYKDCGVKPKTYKSSIESLIRRFIQKKYSPIIPAVDAYNYISARYVLPAGGYNIANIDTSLTLRYANENEKFVPLGNAKDVNISSNHIVYADENENDPIICWLWNHKDSKRTMLTQDVDRALFIFDSVDVNESTRLEEMMTFFINTMESANVRVLNKGVLKIDNKEATL
jgi:lysyl-tRNA synthetase class 2